MNSIFLKQIQSPIGQLLLGDYDDTLCYCGFGIDILNKNLTKIAKSLKSDLVFQDTNLLKMAHFQLDEYFAKKRTYFNLPFYFVGSDFQRDVWTELIDLSYGKTISYLQLAEQCEHPKSVRAVANAVGANNLPIFVPCHRVISSNGSIGGYSGGIEKKRFLLSIENVVL
ncbi:MAG: methylated-DNA--[protein]-cysteine S-methyltransferase [Bacteroidales bacterium]|nr:methylated-DNA--[protein]-cysteine S-methyltransferase [Bacteroidales bacterium]